MACQDVNKSLIVNSKAMATKIYDTFNLDNVGFGEPRTNNNGGKLVPLYDTEPKTRVQFQLGELGDTVDTTTALRVAFPPEAKQVRHEQDRDDDRGGR